MKKGTCQTPLSPNIWGPAAWRHLHAVSFGYPLNPSERDKAVAFAFVVGFAHTLPCMKCRTHFIETIRSDVERKDETFHDKDSFTRATVAWHNAVNERLGKPIVSYEEVHDAHFKCIPKTERVVDVMCMLSNIVSVLVILLLVYFATNTKRSRGGDDDKL